jgi:MATE family multidrug resistance protein
MLKQPSQYLQEARQLLQLGVPMVATQLFIMGMGFVDTVMAGRYSATDLAGVAMGGNVLWPVFMFMSGLTMALTPIVAQLRGADEISESGEKIRQGLWIALATGVVTVAILLNVEPLYIWMGVDERVTAIAIGYLKACAWGVPPVLIYVSLRYTAEGLGHTKPPMVIAAATLILNIPFNYMFIYGKFGMPELGGVGCGVATSIVYWFEFLVMMYVIRLPFFVRTGLTATFSWPNFKGLKEILKIGLPIGASSFVGMMVYAIIGFLIAGIGVNEIAAHSIAGNLNWLTYVIPMSLGSAVSIRVGFALGAFDADAARRVIRTTLSVTLGYAFVVTFLLVAFRHYMVALYTTDAGVLAIAATLMLFVACYQIFDDMQATMGGVLRGFKDTLVPMIIALINYWFISLPIGYVLANGLFVVEPLGVYGYWYAMTFGLFLTASCVGIRLWFTTRARLRRLELSSHAWKTG